MRLMLVPAAFLLCASPVLAQAPAASSPQVPPELTDPAIADRIGDAMQALSKAFLDLKVGEIQAAVEGRKPTTADRNLTIRDLGRRGDPNFARDVQRQVAEAKPMIRQSVKALTDALPSMMQGLEQAQKSLERAAANMPDPTYPKR
jgi:hypothetical protein